MALRAYKVWQGRNRFWCRGWLMSGPNLTWAKISLALMTLPSILFFASPAVDLADRSYTWIPVALGVLFALTLASFFATATSDPGVIPRNRDTDRHDGGRTVMRRPRGTINVVVGGRPFKLKYCTTCDVYRPPRAIHCGLCGNCVEVFDHHCPWVGNCIGKRNYLYFNAFLWTVTSYAGCIVAACVYHMLLITDEERDDDPDASQGKAFWRMLLRNPLSLLIACFASVAFFAVFGLCGFHVYLITSAQTTNELIKHTYRFRSPYSRGPCANYFGLCSRPAPPNIKTRTKVHNKALVPIKHPVVTYLDPRLSDSGGSGSDSDSDSDSESDDLEDGRGLKETTTMSHIDVRSLKQGASTNGHSRRVEEDDEDLSTTPELSPSEDSDYEEPEPEPKPRRIIPKDRRRKAPRSKRGRGSPQRSSNRPSRSSRGRSRKGTPSSQQYRSIKDRQAPQAVPLDNLLKQSDPSNDDVPLE